MVWPRQKDARGENTKLIMEWIPYKRRKSGRPRKMWMEEVQAVKKTRNLEPDQWRNREEWRLDSGRRRQLLKQPDGWMDGWMDRWMSGWVDGSMGGWMVGWVGGLVDGWIDGWIDGWMDGWMDRWMGRWVDGWMDG